MAIEITVPRLGWNMDEGVFVGWLKTDGDIVRVGDPLFTLESEKTTEDIESFDHGILRIAEGAPRAGETVAVGAVIGYLTEVGEDVSSSPAIRTDVDMSSPASASTQGTPLPNAESFGPTPHGGVARSTDGFPSQRRDHPSISPRARRIAAELGMDWTQLSGSGRTGRIRERDVRAAATQASQMDRRTELTPGKPLPISAIRRTIADRMVASLRATAPVTLTTAVDASNLVNLRSQFKAVAKEGSEYIPSYSDFVIKLVASTLQKHPRLNARWEGDALIAPDRIDIGFAVDTEAGLLVPVIRDVPRLSLRDLAASTSKLVETARQGTLKASEMQGGTFTVTNLGAFGIDAFTPIINSPQCAILGVGRIQRKPVALDDQIVIRDQVVLSLTFDHRVVDGAPAARFLQALGGHLEQPGPWLVA
jgi:pyruvate dehydrogenase E2 component (dihydrolipoamide acetyltransferase)